MNQHAQRAAKEIDAALLEKFGDITIEEAATIITTYAIEPSVKERDKMISELCALLKRVRKYIPANAINATKAMNNPIEHCYTDDEVNRAISTAEKLLKGEE